MLSLGNVVRQEVGENLFLQLPQVLVKETTPRTEGLGGLQVPNIYSLQQEHIQVVCGMEDRLALGLPTSTLSEN